MQPKRLPDVVIQPDKKLVNKTKKRVLKVDVVREVGESLVHSHERTELRSYARTS